MRPRSRAHAPAMRLGFVAVYGSLASPRRTVAAARIIRGGALHRVRARVRFWNRQQQLRLAVNLYLLINAAV